MGCCQSKETTKKPEAKKPEPKPDTTAKKRSADNEQPKAAAMPPEEPADPRVERIHAIRGHQQDCPYRYYLCSVKGGDVKEYFENGLIFRIIKGDSWFIYNDTLDYEAQVDFRFGPGSKISAGERTTLEETEDGWVRANAVVYPLETLHYISGTVNGYKSGITIKPLTDEYRHKIAEKANHDAEEETAAVRELVGEETDEEKVLRRCVDTRTPYVDLHFPPHADSLARPEHDVRGFPEMAFMRPTQYLPADQKSSADAVVAPVVSQAIDCGNLGDSWLMCALAALAEDTTAVENLFAQGTPAEKAVGAYRVSLNKNGWWESVIVDDYLPTVNGIPVFAHSVGEPRELWISLLEKAYAKVHGSYASITGGDTLQALADFTGSPVFRFDNDWVSAAINGAKVGGFVEMLVDVTRKNAATVVLSTPSNGSDTYLGRESQVDPHAFRAKYAKVGLRTGYTYFVERVVPVKKRHTLLFKVRNPWKTTGSWTGAWSYGSPAWKENPDVCDVCDGMKDPKDGSFWVDFEDAKKYFDGGGVILTAKGQMDYRVKGSFEDTVPSAVLEITAAEPIRILLTLSQPDKRGVDRKNPASRLAPIMMTLSKQDGDKQRMVQNTSWNPLHPSDELNFVVGRGVAMFATLKPGERYHVVPRIHRKGVRCEYNRPYVIGIISAVPLEDKVHVEAKHIPAASSVFTNYVAYAAAELDSVDVEHQVHVSGEPLKSAVSSTVVSAPAAAADLPPVKRAPSPVQSEGGASDENIQRVANVHNPGNSDENSDL